MKNRGPFFFFFCWGRGREDLIWVSLTRAESRPSSSWRPGMCCVLCVVSCVLCVVCALIPSSSHSSHPHLLLLLPFHHLHHLLCVSASISVSCATPTTHPVQPALFYPCMHNVFFIQKKKESVPPHPIFIPFLPSSIVCSSLLFSFLFLTRHPHIFHLHTPLSLTL